MINRRQYMKPVQQSDSLVQFTIASSELVTNGTNDLASAYRLLPGRTQLSKSSNSIGSVRKSIAMTKVFAR